jgi:hypothetical protein
MFSWEGTLRSTGIRSAVRFVIGYVIYGSQPKVTALAAMLVTYSAPRSPKTQPVDLPNLLTRSLMLETGRRPIQGKD